MIKNGCCDINFRKSKKNSLHDPLLQSTSFLCHRHKRLEEDCVGFQHDLLKFGENVCRTATENTKGDLKNMVTNRKAVIAHVIVQN